MATPNYDINYNDPRFTQVEGDKKVALSEVEQTYGGMISNADQFYDKQIAAANKYATQQSQIQQQQTDFAIEQINQQKEQTKKDYLKEQSGAYVDWQKQSNQYGANAEEMAAQGMQNTGYSESSQVSMYNTYQNRVATARESYQRAILNYDNAIKEARLQNNAALAEIAYNALQKQLELSLAGFQYKNDLVIAMSDKKMAVDEMYHGRWQDVLAQMNTENSLAEQVRQHNESMAEEKRQYNESLALQQAQLAEEKRQFNETMAYNKAKSAGSGGGGGGRVKKGSGKTMSNGKSGGYTIKGKGGSTVKKDTGKEPTIDTKSVLALGYGPISAGTLDNLVKSGVVQEYESGGKIKFKKSPYALKQGQLFK